MLLRGLSVLGMVAAVFSRETIRPMPAIANSLVNLGKMEVAFYLNGKHPDILPRENPLLASPSFYPKSETVVDDPCPCSSLKNAKDSLFSNPSGLINKILNNNDFFPFNKEPLSSPLCCESHEHMQEGTVVFEFPPNQKPVKPPTSPFLPFIFDSMLPNKPMPQFKTKSIEILLFPNKVDRKIPEFPKLQSTKDKISADKLKSIHIVGDKELPNFNIEEFTPYPPVSIKKDLNAQEKNEKQEKQVDKDDLDKGFVDLVTKTNNV